MFVGWLVWGSVWLRVWTSLIASTRLELGQAACRASPGTWQPSLNGEFGSSLVNVCLAASKNLKQSDSNAVIQQQPRLVRKTLSSSLVFIISCFLPFDGSKIHYYFPQYGKKKHQKSWIYLAWESSIWLSQPSELIYNPWDSNCHARHRSGFQTGETPSSIWKGLKPDRN